MTEIADLPSVRASFLHDPQGDVEIARYQLENEIEMLRVVRREKLLNVVSMSFGALALGAMFYFAARYEVPDRALPIGLILACVIAAPMILFALSNGAWVQYLRSLRATAAGSVTSQPTTRVEIECSSKGVRLSSPEHAQEYGWKFFERVATIGPFIVLLWHNAVLGIAIPRAAFASPTEADQFEAGARRLLDASGYGIDERNRTALGARSVRCSKCSYDLAGLTRAACPECGRSLSSISLHCLQILERPLWKDVFNRRYLLGMSPTERRMQK